MMPGSCRSWIIALPRRFEKSTFWTDVGRVPKVAISAESASLQTAFVQAAATSGTWRTTPVIETCTKVSGMREFIVFRLSSGTVSESNYADTLHVVVPSYREGWWAW